MDTQTENHASDSPVDSTVVSKLVRSTVINNSQIIGGITRAGSILGMVSALLALWSRHASTAPFREILRIGFISLLAVSAGFMILSSILDRALRRCPICRTRITSKTEEKRRCLECDTELWGYWDE
jgi:hypothetical protein